MRETKHVLMKLYWAFVLLPAFMLIACDGEERLTPTPSSSFSPVSSQPIAISLTELDKDPTLFEGEYLQLTGVYHRLPVLVCGEEIYRSPASWGITGDTLQAQASGFESQLEALVPEGNSLAVAGYWLRWNGLVGCGQKAKDMEIWYLEVNDILSPPILGEIVGLSPSESVPEAPMPSPSPAVEQPTPPGPESTPSPTPVTPEPTSTGVVGPPTRTPFVTATLGPDSATATVTGTPATDATPGASGTPTAGATGTIAGSSSATPPNNGTATATGSASPTTTTTPTAGTPQPTATLPTVPTATTSSPLFTIDDQGEVSTEELVGGALSPNTIQAWTFSIASAETVTVSAAGSPGIDLVLSIADASGNTLSEQDLAPAGDVERITGLALSTAGEYQIRVRSQDGAAGSYLLMMLYADSYSFVAKEIISYGTSATSDLAEETDHFWFFNGQSGQSITISVQPNDSSDLFLELYGIDGTNLSGFVDEGAGGEQERLEAFILPDSGVYAIRVGEFDFGIGNYQIVLSGG